MCADGYFGIDCGELAFKPGPQWSCLIMLVSCSTANECPGNGNCNGNGICLDGATGSGLFMQST